MRHVRMRGVCGLGLALALAGGCGGPNLELAPVRGTVTCGDQPVPGGMVIFSPIPEEGVTEPGKGAVGIVDANGNFTLSTYEEGDGALVGRHHIAFSIPEPESEEDIPKTGDPEVIAEMKAEREIALKLAKMPACRVPAEEEVVIAPGENVIEIKLVRGVIDD